MAFRDRHENEYVPISFGEWLPDQPPTGLRGVVTATNVIPDAASYRPFPSLVTFATGVSGRCLGGIVATDGAGNNYNYVGDASKLYSLVATSFTNATRASGGNYTTGSDDFWEFVNWGNTVIGCNGYNDSLQVITLGGATFANLSVGVKAKHLAVMKDFVVAGNISDSALNVYRVRWCAINNPYSWTADAATMADFQDLPSEGGPVQKVLGGEYGVVLQQKSVWRMLFVGSPLVFQFDKVHAQIGAYAAQSAVRYQNDVYFLAEDGFYAFDGSAVKGIGRGKVDKFFFRDLATANAARVYGFVDAPNKLVMWAYPSGSNSGGNPDKLMLYSWAYDRWAVVEGLNIEVLVSSVTTGSTLDSLDSLYGSIDSIPVSLDSTQWQGGQFVNAAFNSSHQLQRFNGSAMAATIETGEFQLFPDSWAQIQEVRPAADGLSASTSVMLVNRNNLTESASVGGTQTYPNLTGFCQFRVNARYFRVRLATAANTDFLHLIGVEVKGTPMGRR